MSVGTTGTAAPPQIDRLRELLAEIADLGHADSVLNWDSRVFMPVGGAGARAEVSGTLGRLSHERFVSDEVGRLLEELRPYEESLDFDSDDAALVRVTRRDWERLSRVPPALTGEMWRANGLAAAAWDEAKARSDFASFLPHLERQLELKRRYIECFEPTEHAYDVLLEEYEPGMTTAQVAEIFATVKEGLVPLIEALRGDAVDVSFIEQEFPVEVQRAASLRILAALGYDEHVWRLDPTSHPFANNPGVGDVRLTTHFDERGLHSLFSSMHEFGHGVYEANVDPALARSPIGMGASSAIHESQSRTWENLVGRSRAFWRWFYPQLQQIVAPRLDSVDEDSFYRAANRVRPGLIRVDADEVTYNLHIILRFELEQALLEGSVAPKDVPEEWNARMRDYLGVDVPDDAHGALQDMHWSIGLVGYFPTYSLGNVVSVQIWERALEELGDLDADFERGEFSRLREWLAEHVYRHGRKFTPGELIERVTGGGIDPAPYLAYLHTKFS